ncbi:MAG: hypothetical protein ACFE0J_13720 [Elainellaceae cyanobacterium]
MPQDTSAQNIRTKQSVLDASKQLPSSSSANSTPSDNQSASDANSMAESYAENLIDELFDDVNRMLDNKAIMVPTSHPSSKNRSSALSSSSDTLSHDELADRLASSPDELGRSDSNHRHKPRHPFGASIDKLLLLAACASLGITAALWFVLHGRQPTPANSYGRVGTETTESGDLAFLDYMQRSLETLDHKADAEKRTAAMTPPDGNGSMNTVSVPSSPDSLAESPERIYIPVYQPPQPLTPSLVNPQPVPFQAQPSQSAPAPAPAPAASASAPTPAASPSPAPTPVANVAPANRYSLVALLQMGDRSAAIFEFDDTARRVEVGAQIGSSGWTLVSVSNQEAMIRRNGEVRSVYIGQSF